MGTGQLDSVLPMELHKELRQLRLNAKLTQAQLADLVGVQQPTISGVERGDVTTSTLILSWIKACKGRITVIPENEDPWLGVPESMRGEALELVKLWVRSPNDLRIAILLALRGINSQK